MLNLPNPETNLVDDIIKSDINVYNFLYDDSNDVNNPHPFSYYKYQGSRT